MIWQCLLHLSSSNASYCGDAATWVTGAATLVTGAATIAVFIVAFIQLWAQQRQLRDGEKRHQAEQISGWIVGEGVLDMSRVTGMTQKDWVAGVTLFNSSTHPIYQVIVNIVVVPSSGRGFYKVGPNAQDRTCLALVPPGRSYTVVPAHYHGMFRRPGVEIGFQDVGGRCWVRSALGTLKEIKETTAEYYHLANLAGIWQSVYDELPRLEDMSSLEQTDLPVKGENS